MEITQTDNITPRSTPPSASQSEEVTWPRLSAQQRDALFAQILLGFTAFEDLERAIGQGDQEQAYRLGRRFADAFRLIVDGGLGWSHQTTEPAELTIPPTELRAIMGRLHAGIAEHYESLRPEHEESEQEFNSVAEARDACAAVLGQIQS